MSRTLPCQSGSRSRRLVCKMRAASGGNRCPRAEKPCILQVGTDGDNNNMWGRYSRRAQLRMRSTLRTVVVLAVAAVLVVVFLRNVDLWRVVREIARAQPAWLAFS